MTRSRPSSCASLAGLAILASASCTTPPTTAGKRPGEVCGDLAYSFFLIAERKDRRTPKEQQLAEARDRVASNGDAYRQWSHVIDLVYRFDGGRADELAAAVLDNCAVNARGEAQVTTLWPAADVSR